MPLWLNSYSTHLKAQAGGYKGRILHKDDLLITKNSSAYRSVLKNNMHNVLHWKADVAEFCHQPNIIRICAGKEYEKLTDESKGLLTTADFLITPHSDRMGYRLVSVILQRNQSTEIISSAVTRGAIQLFPNGQLVILMADHQTAGGYPVIAHVISADMPKLAQLNSNQTIQFQMIEAKAAEDLLWQQSQHLHQLQNACNLRLEEYFLHHALY
jgi:antagonist of KipI